MGRPLLTPARTGAAALAMAAALAASGTVSADGPTAGRTRSLDLSFDGRVDPASDARRPLPDPVGTARRLGRAPVRPAEALPDPRALRGDGAAGADATLRLNLKGFSLFEMREDEGTRLRVRRIRQREMRRPVLSITLQKRF